MEVQKSRLQQIVATESLYWGDEAKPYFEFAELHMQRQWDKFIYPIIKDCEYNIALDFAAGHGRNSVKLIDHAKKVICIDVDPKNIKFLQCRFKGDNRYAIVQNNGYDLSDIPSNSIGLCYSFDSMVHFDLQIIMSYISEFQRVVQPHKWCFVHHSNYDAKPGGDFRKNPHWRNFMSIPLFEHLAIRAGFEVVNSKPIAWAGIQNLDALTLLRKR